MRQQTTQQIDSSEVQGDGSFVVLRRPRWKAMRAALSVFAATGGEESDSDASLAMMDDLLPEIIVDWNWTDEDGEQLPLPKDTPQVIGELDPVEAMFLIQHASEMVALERKN